eukprot:c43558_g1_i1 orf=3-410(-)
MVLIADVGEVNFDKPFACISDVSKHRRWDDDLQRMVQSVADRVQREKPTMDFIGCGNLGDQTKGFLELNLEAAVPDGWEKCLDLTSGCIFFTNRRTGTTTICNPTHSSSIDLNFPPSPSTCQLHCAISSSTVCVPF